jgi:hypothetical protein
MAAERIAPDTLITQTNLTGSITDIDDDPDSPDGNWLTADDDGTDTVCLVGFAAPVGTLSDGADLQEFKAFVRRAIPGGAQNPTVDLALFESGSLVRTISTGTTITNDSGELVTATWNASELAGDGSAAEFRLLGNRSGGPPAARRTVEIGAVEWNATVDDAGGRRRLLIT